MFNICDFDTWNEASDNEFQWKGEHTFFDEANGKSISEKTMVLQMETIFSALKQSISEDGIHKFGLGKIIECILENFLKGKSSKEIFPVLIIMIEKGFSFNTAEEILLKYDSDNKTISKGNEIKQIESTYQNVKNTLSFDITPPSKFPLVLGIGLLGGGLIYFFWLLSRSNFSDLTNIIISIVIMLISIPFFTKYSSEKSKYFYKVVCANMAQWVGSSSNDLIIQWGAPTKTYKFPSDKTMTVLEYKDSIRNYAGYRHKGMYVGQAKTTKYIKSFFVKDGVIINYKYDIT